MKIKTYTGVSLCCDICEEEFNDEYSYPNEETAIDMAQDEEDIIKDFTNDEDKYYHEECANKKKINYCKNCNEVTKNLIKADNGFMCEKCFTKGEL